MGRRRDLRHRRSQAAPPRLLQAARAADGYGELRRAQRLSDSRARARHHGAGVVSGRRVRLRLHGFGEPERDRCGEPRSLRGIQSADPTATDLACAFRRRACVSRPAAPRQSFARGPAHAHCDRARTAGAAAGGKRPPHRTHGARLGRDAAGERVAIDGGGRASHRAARADGARPGERSAMNTEVTSVHPLAGKRVPAELQVDVAELVAAYHAEAPDPSDPAQQVSFGTSGHRGSSLRRSFNDAHIAAVAQAIADYRGSAGTTGPLFIGRDTHALSEPALATALQVFAANDVDVILDGGASYTPTPVISHAVLRYNERRSFAIGDGVVITPSHNPPEDGGFKYNPPSGGPADTDVTSVIERRANDLLADRLRAVKRVPTEQAQRIFAGRTRDMTSAYVADLSSVIDIDAVAASGV